MRGLDPGVRFDLSNLNSHSQERELDSLRDMGQTDRAEGAPSAVELEVCESKEVQGGWLGVVGFCACWGYRKERRARRTQT